MTPEQADDLLGKARIDVNVRPETLTVEQFAAIFRLVRVSGD
jgi:16S rRNA A1518/A1519 N6-dimethyltransferase RsmA/KsgA/DIM1 with predicted DNA glycosylase/AP lyase activity